MVNLVRYLGLIDFDLRCSITCPASSAVFPLGRTRPRVEQSKSKSKHCYPTRWFRLQCKDTSLSSKINLIFKVQVQRLREGLPRQRAAEAARHHPRHGGQVRVRRVRQEAQVQTVTGRPSQRPSGQEALWVSNGEKVGILYLNNFSKLRGDLM